jgi:hypothetical protein
VTAPVVEVWVPEALTACVPVRFKNQWLGRTTVYLPLMLKDTPEISDLTASQRFDTCVTRATFLRSSDSQQHHTLATRDPRNSHTEPVAEARRTMWGGIRRNRSTRMPLTQQVAAGGRHGTPLGLYLPIVIRDPLTADPRSV